MIIEIAPPAEPEPVAWPPEMYTPPADDPSDDVVEEEERMSEPALPTLAGPHNTDSAPAAAPPLPDPVATYTAPPASPLWNSGERCVSIKVKMAA